MNTTLLLISSGLFGVLLGMCIAALLMSNRLDAGRQDTQRLDFAERQKAHIGQHGDACRLAQHFERLLVEDRTPAGANQDDFGNRR